jgi:ribosomal protein S18 acetylase RimI-like enzyme
METDDLSINNLDASESDATEILEIQKLAFHGQAVLYSDFTLPPLVQTLEKLRRDFQKYSFLKAISSGKIVGSVRGRAEGDTCFISRLIVRPDFQNRGIGKRLMLSIERKLYNVKRYELFTGHKSEKNLSLYRDLGYRKLGEKPQSDNVMLICMEKQKA